VNLIDTILEHPVVVAVWYFICGLCIAVAVLAAVYLSGPPNV
jgi:hypothetical protein